MLFLQSSRVGALVDKALSSLGTAAGENTAGLTRGTCEVLTARSLAHTGLDNVCSSVSQLPQTGKARMKVHTVVQTMLVNFSETPPWRTKP